MNKIRHNVPKAHHQLYLNLIAFYKNYLYYDKLQKKLYETGWIEFERGQDFEEYVILPDFNIKILKTFNELTNQKF